ncbi:Fe-S cluster assembly protein SufD [Panacibacter ginsenosidivorans]|uniref:Fe-S cluster assembly protein SufD n=1 Tax=Panacibacter ginsenosidivorans TaxID=1813871 RepID=A0A5B8V513_9BACT|nr:Fe-S cluster assembly protein SufD [Panacibacter ginsenosidivorans]QEC66480.1 Fe-S cluster assembly protein SufD [Panacibacter ginsenosidivorans]
MIKQITTSLYDQFIADFELRSILSASSESASLQGLRHTGFAYFKQLGFPNTKVEDWKYVNLTPFLKDEFITEPEDDVLAIDEKAIIKANIPMLDCYKVVLVNGQYHPELSDTIPTEGIYISALAAAMNRPAFQAHFGKHIAMEKNHFTALNTALFSNGLFIEVKNKTVADKPIHIIHLISADNNLFLQPRHLFVIGLQAEISIVESFVSANKKGNVFVNNVSEIVVDKQAQVQHYYIQTGNEQTKYVHHTEVVQQASSLYNNYKASFPGTSLLRNNLNIVLNGENIESHLYGIYLAGGQQLVDNHTIVDHQKPHCLSNELYKGVMKDEATAVFNGKIFVREDAQKTNAFQKNNNLMLSKKAVVDSKPQLEIYADDVKCSHGSTIGQFNEDALFYLKARGIGDEKAKALLIHAFAYDVTEKIPLPAVQAHINHLIEEGLK